MSYAFSLDPAFAENQYNDAVRHNTSEPPPESRGLLDVVEEDLLNPVTRATAGQGAVLLGLAGSLPFQGIDKVAGTELTDLWMKEVVDPAVTWQKSLKPDPRTTNLAENVLDGVLSFLPSAILTGPVGAGVLPGITETAEHIQDGKPLEVAAKMGATTAITNALGVAMPASVISKAIPLSPVAQRVGTGIAANVGLGAADRAAKHEVLANAGYQEQANQYQAWDKTGVAIDAVFGGVFGRYEAFRRADTDAKLFTPKQEQIDAALTANQARHASELAPGIPTNPAAANAHADALNAHIDALVRGDESPASALINRQAEIPEDLISTAGNRLSRGDRQALDRELADIEFKLSRLDEQEGYRKQDFIDAVREENPRMPARKQAALAEQRAAEAQADGRADIGAMRDRLLQQRNADDEARAAHAEISRIEQQHLLDHGFIEHPEAKARHERVQNVLEEIIPRREGGLRLVRDEPSADGNTGELQGNTAKTPDSVPAVTDSGNTPKIKPVKTVSQQNNVVSAGESADGFVSDATKTINEKDVSHLMPDAQFGEKSDIAMGMPGFKGNKRTVLGMAVSAIKAMINRDHITHIDDWFGGGGMWSTSLANAVLPKVKTIRISELNHLRIKRIEWMHERGDKLFEDMQRTGALDVYRKIVKDLKNTIKDDGTPISSPSPFGDIADYLAGDLRKKAAGARARASGALNLSDEGKVLMSALGDLAFGNRGAKIHKTTSMVLPDGVHADPFLEKAITQFKAAHDQAQLFKSRGGKYEYFPAGSSYDLVQNHAIQGSHVLSLADPPYYNTTGYKGAGDFATGDKWNAKGYQATRDLLKTLVDKGNHIIYTDEAWWRKSDQLDDVADAGNILSDIDSIISDLYVAPKKVGDRYEQLGIHRPNSEQGSVGSNSSSSRGDTIDGRGSSVSGRNTYRRLAGGIGEQSGVSAEQSASPGKVTPELNAARQSITERGDKVINIENDDGTVTTMSAEEALRLVDDEAAMAEQSDVTMSEAIACFFKNGDRA
jgi:hypothetical protein